MDEFNALTEDSALQYIEQSSLRHTFFKADDVLSCRDLADGNVNLVFRVAAQSAPLERSLIVKQALPFARRYPDFKMPLERAEIENGVLEIHNRYCAGLAPKVYHYDSERFINVMEDLNTHIIMREGMMKQIVYPKFGRDIGTFLASSLFYTSDLYMNSGDKKRAVTQFTNPVLCKVTEDLVFTFPYGEHETNRYPPQLQSVVTQFLKTPGLQARVRSLKLSFMTNAQSLLHGDLHTGSIMVNPEETKVIDPEFAFYGPIGFDVGNVIANFIISWASQEFHATSDSSRAEYRTWISQTIREIWNTFSDTFVSLWMKDGQSDLQNTEFYSDFMSSVFIDTLGFAACEMTRRTIGMAHVPDLDTITDEATLCLVSKIILETASQLLTDTKIHTIDEVISLLGAQ